MTDPKTLRPGQVIVHRTGGPIVLDKRKDDNSGWWTVGSGGLADSVWASGDWIIPVGRIAGRCTTHDDLAWIYPDGSIGCMDCLIVEIDGSDCRWEPMPHEWTYR